MIHIVIGTKAQLVKMAPIMIRLQDRGVPYNFVFTGQHRETIGEMLDEFGVKRPDVILYSGRDVVSLAQMALWTLRLITRALFSRRQIFGSDRRGIVLVHGDTFSTLLGALMGRLARLRVGHVESGLRSFALFDPFPEEITRVATFRLSHVLYCPGARACANVQALGRETVDTFENTLADTLGLALGRERKRDHVPDTPFGLVSLHRFENVFRRESIRSIVDHLDRVARRHPLLFILHPPTIRQLKRFGLYERLERHPGIELRPRYTYFDFVSLLERARFVITDGGSVQEESFYLGLPCLLMRRNTERQEGLGENALLSAIDGPTIDDFVANFERFRRPRRIGERSPSEVIVDSVLAYA